MFDSLTGFIREQYQSSEFIPLHAPVFIGQEQEFVASTIDSTFVSSVGAFVDRFEENIAAYTGSSGAVATVNGTAALHLALLLAGVQPGEIVITQPLTFVATCNAISYTGAVPVFVDVDRHTLGLSPAALEQWLADNACLDDDGTCRLQQEDTIIRACVPMHTFGHPVELDRLLAVCKEWNLTVVEDAAESLGSKYQGKHAGTFGRLAALSFNGNKIMTTGGGGMILCNKQLAVQAKHLSTTAKLDHAYEYVHDVIGFNYRLPNLNAALGCAQLEQLERFVAAKRDLAGRYAAFLADSELEFVIEPSHCRSNYWLNAVICKDCEQRDELLAATNGQGVMTRPIWELMNRLPMFSQCCHGDLTTAEWLRDRVVNLPSSVLPEYMA